MKRINKSGKVFTVLFLLLTCNAFAQSQQKEILLIGTFHFNNPGADIAQVNTFDVTTKKSQAALEKLSNKIKTYQPDKIFVEWNYNKQLQLDSLYELYLNNQYDNYVSARYPGKTFYTQNEIFQLAFKAAKKLNLAKVYAIDYNNADFPFDSLMVSIDKAKQPGLKTAIYDKVKQFEKESNDNRKKFDLIDLIVQSNTKAYRQSDLGAYITLFNQAGEQDNFVGAYLVSEWYKRNLYMYALLQKIIESKDKKVMVLLGASHIALFKKLIELDENYKSIELKEIL